MNTQNESLPDYKVAEQELQAFYDTLGISAEISGAHAAIDTSNLRDSTDKGWAHVAVTVTFTRTPGDNGHGRAVRSAVSFSTPYKMGVGLADWKALAKHRAFRSPSDCNDIEAMASHASRLTVAEQCRIAGKHLSAFVKRVSLAEVLANVCRDGSDACDRSFESWASEYGYDTDSRRAEETYRACQKAGDGVRKLLSHSPGAVEKLADLACRL